MSNSSPYTLYAVRIFSQRWDAAVEFYRDTLGMVPGFASAELGWAEFPVGGAVLALERLADDDPEAVDLVGRYVGISLEVDDIAAAYERLIRQGVQFHAPPEQQPWGGVLAHFKDPDGNTLTLLGRATDA